MPSTLTASEQVLTLLQCCSVVRSAHISRVASPTGLAVGAASVLAPAYISEVAPARFRGALATVQQIAFITGLFIAFFSNYLLADAAGSSTSEFWLGFEAWRWMFWVEMFPATSFLVALFFIPESPRFLVLTRRRDEATAVLTKLVGADEAEQKIEEIDSSLAADHHKPQLRDLLDPNTNRIRRLVWTGIGRKPLLLAGSIGLAASLGTLVVAFVNATTAADGSLTLEGIYGPMALVAANVYVIFFNASWGPVMWVMLGEMFPNQIRGTGLAVSGLSQWGTNFVITITFPILLATIGLAGAYGLYTASAILSIIFVIKMAHETRGIELEDMQG